MTIDHLYVDGFPDKHKVKEVDVVSLYHQERFDELDKVVVCKDESGHVTATFGDSDWNCLPFSRKKEKNRLIFKNLDGNPALQRELKLFTYAWLFNKSTQGLKAIVFSAVESRLTSIKKAYDFLNQNHQNSIRALSISSIWSDLETHLIEKEYSQSSMVNCFAAINSVIKIESWHKVDHGFTQAIEAKILARKLNAVERQQTFTIPERLCSEIYGKAIELIEHAHPYRKLIAQVEKNLQDNYLEGKRILDKRIKDGSRFASTNGEISNKEYQFAVIACQPKKPRDIIANLAQKHPSALLETGDDFRQYLGHLITASYIVLGGFSGMRDSELDKLTPNSYYKDNFEGRDYHMLQSHTFKLGEKRETWVTASSSKTAIELMTTLTDNWREEADYSDKKYSNTIWLNQYRRSNAPMQITGWNKRLRRFCKYFNFKVTEDDYKECLDSNPKSHEKIKKNIEVGKPWPLATHQFRRTVAFYCIKNRFGTLVALKQQFKHLYLAMTEWYTKGGKLASYRNLIVDDKIKAMLDDINAETTANKIFKQWHSDEHLSGSHGKTIMKMRNDVPTIYSSWEIIYRAVKDGKLTLHSTLHSHCKAGYKCDMDGAVAPQFCVDCDSASIDAEQAQFWKRKHSSLVSYMNTESENIQASERSHYITQVRAAQKVMQDFNIKFVPFEAELDIVEV